MMALHENIKNKRTTVKKFSDHQKTYLEKYLKLVGSETVFEGCQILFLYLFRPLSTCTKTIRT